MKILIEIETWHEDKAQVEIIKALQEKLPSVLPRIKIFEDTEPQIRVVKILKVLEWP